MFLRHKYIFVILYVPILILFTIYVLFDVFAIARVYQRVEVSEETASEEALISTKQDTLTSEGSESEAITTENSYQDENISITMTQYCENDADIYVDDVTVSDAVYLKTLFASDVFGKNVTETTSSMAGRGNAVLAVDGDYATDNIDDRYRKTTLMYLLAALGCAFFGAVYELFSHESIRFYDICFSDPLCLWSNSFYGFAVQ